MKAIAIIDRDGKPGLTAVEAAEPQVGPRQILVAVRFAGVNRADLLRHAAHYGHADKPAEAPIAGLEMAGEVVAVGSDVTRFAPGDRVMAMASRAYAEKVVVDERLALRVPRGFSWQEAAATAVSFMTAHDAIVTNGALQAGETVLVQATTSGAGIAGVQVAKALGASVVLGTSGSPQKLEKLQGIGLDVGINAKTQDTVAMVLEATDGKGVNVIMDNIGKGVLQQNVDCAAILGRIVQVGRMGGYVDEIDLDELAKKRLRLIGVTFRTRSVEEHSEVVQRFEDDLYERLSQGDVKPLIDKAFDLDAAEEAQEYMRSNAHIGKVLLRVS